MNFRFVSRIQKSRLFFWMNLLTSPGLERIHSRKTRMRDQRAVSKAGKLCLPSFLLKSSVIHILFLLLLPFRTFVLPG